MEKFRLSDMTTKDKQDYKYYKRLLSDLDINGHEWSQERAHKEVNRLEQKYNRQEENYQKLLNAIESGVVLTDKEIKSLMWLATCEPETLENICSVINKVKYVAEPNYEDE